MTESVRCGTSNRVRGSACFDSGSTGTNELRVRLSIVNGSPTTSVGW